MGTKMFPRGGGTYVRAPKYSYAVEAITFGHQNIRTWWWHLRSGTNIFVRAQSTYVWAPKCSYAVKARGGGTSANPNFDVIMNISNFNKYMMIHLSIENLVFPCKCTKQLSSSSNILQSESWDISIKIWNFDTGKCIRTLTEHSDLVSSLQFPTKGTLASGSWDKFAI